MSRTHANPRPAVEQAYFEKAAAAAGFVLDARQREAVSALAGTSNVYLVGPVGRGKTWLLDAYVAALPSDAVQRIHWHGFVRDLHLILSDHTGLDAAINKLISAHAVICFDELHVNDRADGIFIHQLLAIASELGRRVVTTSNSFPHELMPNPLLHPSFAPTIAVLERTFQVVELNGPTDYRRYDTGTNLFTTGSWIVSADPVARQTDTPAIRINGRSMTTWDPGPEHLGVTFAEICEQPWGSTDYLKIAEQYPSITVSEVPALHTAGREAALRFVHLIDILYDQNVPTTIHSALPLNEFGMGQPSPTGAPRLLSRLSTLRTE